MVTNASIPVGSSPDTTFAGAQLNTSWLGLVTSRSTANPLGADLIKVKHSPAGASALPGCDGAWSPPPVQLLAARARRRRQSRVRFDPQALTDSAKSSHADQDCAPRAFGLAPPAYFASRSMYCFVAGWLPASSNGTNEVTA